MAFISSPERYGHRRGLWRGIQALLKVRFGEEGLKLMPEVEQIHAEEKLEAIVEALETPASPEEVRRVWSSGTP